MISCSEAVTRLWDYLDGLVDSADHESVEAHLARCRRCCGEREFAKELRRTLESAAHVDMPENVLRRLNHTLEELEP